MKRHKWTKEDEEKLVIMKNEGMSDMEVGEYFDVSEEAVRHKVVKMRNGLKYTRIGKWKGEVKDPKKKPMIILSQNYNMPQVWENVEKLQNKVSPKLKGWLRLSGDWAITSDFHAPGHSIKWIRRLLAVCKKLKIDRLIVGGDLFNADIYSIFNIDKQQITPTMEQELEIVESTLDMLETQFLTINLILGNHENRLFNILRHSISEKRLLKMMDRFHTKSKYTFSPYPYLMLNDWRVTHPRSYRQTKLSTANALASKFSCNVMMAHGHFFSIGYSQGGYLICDSGGMFEGERIPYKMFSDTTHPEWNPGFFVYQNGIMKPFADGYTNWGEYNTK